MAVNIGPKIGIDGEAQYRKELSNLIQATKTYKSQMEGLTKTFDQNTSKVEQAKQKTELLKKAQESAQAEVDKMRDAVQKSSEAYGDADTKTLKWKEQLAKAEGELADINQQLSDNTPLKSWGAELEDVGNSLQEVGDKIASVGKSLSTYVTAPIVALATASVKTSADFDSSMSQVQATMGITKDAMSELNGESVNTMDSMYELAEEMGASTAWSAQECADAINYLALAGYDTQEIYDTLPTVLNLASAGGMELASASDMVTDAMSALGLGTEDAETMVDQMAKTASSSNTSVEQLGEAILTIGATGKTVAGGTTELNTALGILANNGIKGSEGGTHLRNVLLSLQSPTDDAKGALDDLGVSVYDAEGNMRPLNDILGDLNTSMEGMTSEDKQNIISTIFNKTDLASASALLDNCGDAWDDLESSISDSGGAADQMADTQLDNLNGQLTLLKSALEGAAIAVGEKLTPFISDLVEKIQGVVDWFNSLSDAQLEQIVQIAAIVAAIGPVLAIVGTVISTIGTVVAAIGGIATAVGTMTAAMSAGSGIIGALVVAFGAVNVVTVAVVAAIAAVIAIGVALYKNWDKITAAADELKTALSDQWNSIKEKTTEAWNNAKQTVTNNINGIKTGISNGLSAAYSTVTSKLNSIKNKFSSIFNSIKNTVSNIINRIKGLTNFTFSTPKLKVPHFSISPSGWKVGDLLKGSIPTLSVDWRKRGYFGAIYEDTATILPNGTGIGDGYGGEFTVGEAHLMDDMNTAINNAIGERMAGIYSLLETYLPSAGNIYLDGKTLVGATVSRYDQAMGGMINKSVRGVV